MVCFSLIGFFTALFEPLLFKKRLSWIELCFALITVVGVMCIFSFDARHRTGIAIGVVSSAVCSLYAVCNKKVSAGVRSRTVLMYQMSGGLVAVSRFILVSSPASRVGCWGLRVRRWRCPRVQTCVSCFVMRFSVRSACIFFRFRP